MERGESRERGGCQRCYYDPRPGRWEGAEVGEGVRHGGEPGLELGAEGGGVVGVPGAGVGGGAGVGAHYRVWVSEGEGIYIMV